MRVVVTMNHWRWSSSKAFRLTRNTVLAITHNFVFRTRVEDRNRIHPPQYLLLAKAKLPRILE